MSEVNPIHNPHRALVLQSGLFRWWGGGQEEQEAGGRADPELQLAVRHAVKDEARGGLELALAPSKVFTVVRDDKNRVMLVDNLSGTVIQVHH